MLADIDLRIELPISADCDTRTDGMCETEFDNAAVFNTNSTDRVQSNTT